jgi:ABC-type phosphate transport system substrate-binding protein
MAVTAAAAAPAGWSSSLIGVTRAQDLRAFLTWAVTSGTAQLAKVNFQPLPPSVITLSDAQIARIKG